MTMPPVQIREISPTDLDSLHELCERALEFDRCPRRTLAEKILDPADAGWGLLAEADGRPIGLIQGSPGRGNHSATGFIRLIAVEHSWRQKGIGSQLLKELENRFAKKGLTTLSTGDCPHNYFQPGVDFRSTETHCFFWKHGFEFFRENHNLLAPLPPPGYGYLHQDIQGLADHGIRVSLAEPGDFPACETFLKANWEPWITEARHALEAPDGGLWLAWDGEEVVGFSAYGGNNSGLPWFGPMGTKPGMRGKGVGALLLRLCLGGLYDLGYREAIIPWVGPIRFYARFCGAKVDRSFWVHRKTLAPASQ